MSKQEEHSAKSITGIKIKGGGENTIEWNVSIGLDVGIDVEDSWNNLLKGNIQVSKEVIQIYGEDFKDIIFAIQRSRDMEALLAFGNIINTKPDSAIAAWEILIKKFGTQIGNFSVATLSGVVSTPVYAMLKTALQAHGIILP